MELTSLRYFYEVARHKGFTRAAAALRAQQPTLSRAITQLEEEFGVRLFERTTRRVHLTEGGERLFLECRKLFELVEQMPAAVRSMEAEFQGFLQFGITDSLSQIVMPETVRRFAKDHPRVISSIATGIGPHLIQKVEQGELEFALMFAEPGRSLLNVTTVATVPFVFAISTKHRQDKNVRRSYIAARETEDARDRDSREWDLLREISPDMQIRFSANSYVIHKSLVLSGLGISVLPKFFVREELRQKKLTPIGRPLSFSLNLITRKDRPLSTRAEAFVQTLTRAVKEMVEGKA